MDVFFNQNPIIPDNQRHLQKQEKVPSVRARTKAMGIVFILRTFFIHSS